MAAREGGRFPAAADPKPRWSPQGAVPARGQRKGGVRPSGHARADRRSEKRARAAAGARAASTSRRPRRPHQRRALPVTRAKTACWLSHAPRERAAAVETGGRAPRRRAAAARRSRRQERQRGAAGSGVVSAARRRSHPKGKRLRQRPHAESASRRALRAPKERATATGERRSSATPPRARRHDQAGARSASAAPQAAAP